jgi:hypothetical protein
MTSRTTTERILDAYLAPEGDRLPDRVIEAVVADVARTPQRRAARAPWRFRHMPVLSRPTGIAAVALVAVLGAAGLMYLRSIPGGTGSRPTPTPTLGPSEVAPGISGWKTYHSDVHGFTVGYPENWSLHKPAGREWQAGDQFPSDELPYADTFVSPEQGDAQIGLFVWEMPAGEDVDVESVADLKAWADSYCSDVGAGSCEQFTQRAVSMCHNAGGSCRGAILVPTGEAQYAFFGDWGSMMFTDLPDQITVVVVAREDDFPSAARYGGSVELLKSILTTMDVR